jgi:exodeoxyribonuclease VII small subunit
VNEDVEALAFEAARAELDDVVRRLEDGGTTLEQALALWERGEVLHRRCAALLTTAAERLEALRPAGAPD